LPGFEDDSNGKCIHGKTRGENCSASECDAQQGLACFEGVCGCVLPTLDFVDGVACAAEMGGSCGILKPFGECGETLTHCDYFVLFAESGKCQPFCEGAAYFEMNSDLPYRCTQGLQVSHTT